MIPRYKPNGGMSRDEDGKYVKWDDTYSVIATLEDEIEKLKELLARTPATAQTQPVEAQAHNPASDLSDPEPGEHQEVLDAIAAHNSGEEE